MLPMPVATQHAWPLSARPAARLIAVLSMVGALVAGCALEPLRQLPPGSSAEDVRRVMGEPWSKWNGADGAMHWVYPTGPLGRRTHEVRFDAAGKVRSVEDVLNDRGFARLHAGSAHGDLTATAHHHAEPIAHIVIALRHLLPGPGGCVRA